MGRRTNTAVAEPKTLELISTNAVDIALRSLDEDERGQMRVWFQQISNWNNDKFVRDHSHRLPSTDDTYVYMTPSEFRIFFRLDLKKQKVWLLDIATRATILLHARAEGAKKK